MIFRSLDRRISPPDLLKEIRLKFKMSYEPKVFLVDDDHFVVRLISMTDYARMKREGSWFVDGQLLIL